DGIRDFHVTGVQTCALPIFIAPTINTHPTDGQRVDRIQMKTPVDLIARLKVQAEFVGVEISSRSAEKPTIVVDAIQKQCLGTEQIGRASCRERVDITAEARS